MSDAFRREWFEPGSTWWKSLKTRAVLSAWVQARQQGINVDTSDVIAIAAIEGFAKHVLLWASQKQGGVSNKDDDGNHVYMSTSCLHGKHIYCQEWTGAVGDKVPAKCKFCSAKCVCQCHKEDA